MAKVNTVLGPMNTQDLGFTLMHEHLLCAFPNAYREYSDILVPNALEYVGTRLKQAKAGGVDTVVDMTTLDLGRDIHFMREAAKQSGVNIIACTGWWLDVPRFVSGLMGSVSVAQMAESFVREIEKGIGDTGIKPGILKSASDVGGVTPPQEVALRAVARAHLKTGVPIVIHSYHPGQVAKQQLDILKEEGVNLKYVKVDHCNDTTDVEYLTWILEQGCTMGLDRYPGRLVSPMARTKTLKALMDAGFSDKLCPSHDCLLSYVLPEGFNTEQFESLNPHRILYLKKVVFPWLKEMGVAEDKINNLCLTGPRNFLEGK
jgi:phosphotriesterase-related protein